MPAFAISYRKKLMSYTASKGSLLVPEAVTAASLRWMPLRTSTGSTGVRPRRYASSTPYTTDRRWLANPLHTGKRSVWCLGGTVTSSLSSSARETVFRALSMACSVWSASVRRSLTFAAIPAETDEVVDEEAEEDVVVVAELAVVAAVLTLPAPLLLELSDPEVVSVAVEVVSTAARLATHLLSV